jgi:hypothetical protein
MLDKISEKVINLVLSLILMIFIFKQCILFPWLNAIMPILCFMLESPFSFIQFTSLLVDFNSPLVLVRLLAIQRREKNVCGIVKAAIKKGAATYRDG